METSTNINPVRPRARGRRIIVGLGLTVLSLAGAALLWVSVVGPRIDSVPSRKLFYAAAAVLVSAVAAMYAWRRTSLWRLRRREREERDSLLTRVARAADDSLAQVVALAGVTLDGPFEPSWCATTCATWKSTCSRSQRGPAFCGSSWRGETES